MPAGPCCVQNCFKGGKSKHRFPNPSKQKVLFDKWVLLCGNKRLMKEATPLQIFNNYRICSNHFRPDDFGPNNILKRGVLPSLNIPGEISTAYNVQEEVSKDQLNTDYGIEPVASTSKISCYSEGELLPSMSKMSCTTEHKHIPETPKKRSLLLHEVNSTQKKDLTPKAKHLYTRVLHFKRKAMSLKKRRFALKKRLLESEKAAKIKLTSTMDKIKARFFQSQVENVAKRPKGRRYSIEDKVLALSIYKQSGAAYRYLASLFALPSPKTITRLLNRIPIQAGLHEEICTILKAECKAFKTELDKHCIIMFDEVSLQAHLHYKPHLGTIEGFEDFGDRRSDNLANHAQVFMIRGIRRKWKQPIYYNFVNGSTKKEEIMKILKNIIRMCHNIGLNVVATICDQGGSNQGAINGLIRETQDSYKRSGSNILFKHFEVDSRKIIPLYDVPHLFKGLRNNLMKYNLSFKEDDQVKVAKWSDIFKAYKMDPYLGSLRLMPKLTDAHVNPEKINKMKVSKCTQVFSHSVAAAINVFAFTETTVCTEEENLKMEKRAKDTACLLEFLDLLFDSLNGSSFQSNPGKIWRVAVTNGSGHIRFWNEALSKLSTFTFDKKGKSFIPPSLKNLIFSIRNFKDIWQTLQQLGFNYMMPRTFNQDPIENFFCKIRQRGHRNINPTPSDFNSYYKSLLVNQLTSSQSVGANCEDDQSDILLTLQMLVTQGLPEEDDTEQIVYHAVPTDVPQNIKSLELKVLKYVSGYVIKKIGKQPCSCKKDFLRQETAEDFEHEEFLKNKEFRAGHRSLQYVNSKFLTKMKMSLAIVKHILNRDISKKKVSNYIFKILCERISFTDCFHDKLIKTHIFNYFIKVSMFNYVNQINKIVKGLDLRPIPNNAPKVFLNAKKLYLNSIKRKKVQDKNRLSTS